MLSIGEFSHATRLTVKTLRYYQELGILIPAETDEITGYRYFDNNNYERARSIIMLKELGFTLKEISTILRECSTENDLSYFIGKKLNEVEKKLKNLKDMKRELESLKTGTEGSDLEPYEGIVEIDFRLPAYAGYEMQGAYDQIGKGYARLYKRFGRFAQGKPFAFYAFMEQHDEDARYEAVIQLNERASRDIDGTKSFPSTKAVKMLYKGPYGFQGPSYMKLFDYCRSRGYQPKAPIIEHFVKGPGMIFKGNPEAYLTECIVLIES